MLFLALVLGWLSLALRTNFSPRSCHCYGLELGALGQALDDSKYRASIASRG